MRKTIKELNAMYFRSGNYVGVVDGQMLNLTLFEKNRREKEARANLLAIDEEIKNTNQEQQ